MNEEIKAMRESLADQEKAEFDSVAKLADHVIEFAETYGFMKTVHILQANINALCAATDQTLNDIQEIIQPHNKDLDDNDNG